MTKEYKGTSEDDGYVHDFESVLVSQVCTHFKIHQGIICQLHLNKSIKTFILIFMPKD